MNGRNIFLLILMPYGQTGLETSILISHFYGCSE